MEADTQGARVVDVLASVQGVELGESGVQSHPQPHGEFEDSLGYKKPCPKSKKGEKELGMSLHG